MKNLLILMLIILSSSVAFSQTFIDIAASAGIEGGKDWQGVSFADFDNDGDEDIFIVRHDGPSGALYQNNGDGTFTDITNIAGLSETENEGGIFGDYNNDGLLDLYVSNEGSPNFLFRNNGDETFTDVSNESGANHSGLAISSLFGDYNNDGLLDIYVVNLSGANILYRNNGDGTFTNVTDAAGVGNTGSGITAVWSDFNLDGKLDLYVANQNANVLYLNNGYGIFTDVTATSGVGTNATSEGTASADFDNDGDMDIYVANNGTRDILYQNNGDGTFTDISVVAGISNSRASLGISFGDLDNDGWLDIFVANSGNANVLYHNNADGVFSDISTSAGIEDATGQAQGTAFGDIDGDGDLDIFVTNLNLQNRLYRNEGNSNNWLNVTLQGQPSNRFGIGVRVKVKSAGIWQTREVDGGSGFSSQNSIPLEFGLGNSTIVDSVIVYWSSGLVSVLTQVDINGTINVIELPRTLDVQVNRMVSPETLVKIISGSALNVKVHITNKGTVEATNFNILCLIDTNNVIVYSETANISSLPGLDTMSVTFPDWVPLSEAVYKFTFINQLQGDEYSVNDTVKVKGEILFEKPPIVIYIKPEDSAIGVLITNQIIRAKFSEIMDSSSIDSTSVIVSGSISGPIPGEIIFQTVFNSFIFVRPSDFTYAFGETVIVNLTTKIRSIIGLTLDGNENGIEEDSPTDDYTLSFTIIEQPVSVDWHSDEKVSYYQLNQNYPNPFNSTTTIRYNLSNASGVELRIYNILGKKIKTLVDEKQPAGSYSVEWNGKDDFGKEVVGGIYFFQMKAKDYVQVKKLLLVK